MWMLDVEIDIDIDVNIYITGRRECRSRHRC